jgi:hypothetical protein
VRTALVRAKGKPDAAARKAASLKVADRTSEKRAGRASRSETKTAAKTHASQKRTHVADAR